MTVIRISAAGVIDAQGLGLRGLADSLLALRK
jgi:hypothetical protein